MSYHSDLMLDQMEIEHFVEERRGDYYSETTRVMRDSKGRFECVYGELHNYDSARNVFIPYTGTRYQVEPVPTSNEPVGYHGLNESDL